MRKVIALALANNRDLRVAALNIERAQALYRIQRAALFPHINAGADGGKAMPQIMDTQPLKASFLDESGPWPLKIGSRLVA